MKKIMLAKFIAADDDGLGVAEITDGGYYVVAHSERQTLKVGDIVGGRFDEWQNPEIEIQPLDPRQQPFKLSKLVWSPDVGQAINNLRSHSHSAQIRVDQCALGTAK